jgi:hypothetical protein
MDCHVTFPVLGRVHATQGRISRFGEGRTMRLPRERLKTLRSASGHHRLNRPVCIRSASARSPDIVAARWDFAFVPVAALSRCSKGKLIRSPHRLARGESVERLDPEPWPS